jgi:hypothetical protein
MRQVGPAVSRVAVEPVGAAAPAEVIKAIHTANVVVLRRRPRAGKPVHKHDSGAARRGGPGGAGELQGPGGVRSQPHDPARRDRGLHGLRSPASDHGTSGGGGNRCPRPLGAVATTGSVPLPRGGGHARGDRQRRDRAPRRQGPGDAVATEADERAGATRPQPLGPSRPPAGPIRPPSSGQAARLARGPGRQPSFLARSLRARRPSESPSISTSSRVVTTRSAPAAVRTSASSARASPSAAKSPALAA